MPWRLFSFPCVCFRELLFKMLTECCCRRPLPAKPQIVEKSWLNIGLMISLHACSMGTHRKGCFHARVVVLIWYGQMLKKTVLRWQRYLLSMRLAMRPVKKKFIACTRRTFVWVAVFFYQNLWEHVWSERVPTANQHAFGTGRSVFNHSFVLFNFFCSFYHDLPDIAFVVAGNIQAKPIVFALFAWRLKSQHSGMGTTKITAAMKICSVRC